MTSFIHRLVISALYDVDIFIFLSHVYMDLNNFQCYIARQVLQQHFDMGYFVVQCPLCFC